MDELVVVRSGATDAEDGRAKALTLDLADTAGDVVAPPFIVFGAKDRLFPFTDAERLRDSVSGPVELLLLDEGNHGCANVAPGHRPYTADWLAHHLTAHKAGS